MTFEEWSSQFDDRKRSRLSRIEAIIAEEAFREAFSAGVKASQDTLRELLL